MLKNFSNINKNILLNTIKDEAVINVMLFTTIFYTAYIIFIYSLYDRIFNVNIFSISTNTHNHLFNITVKLNDVSSFLLLLFFFLLSFIGYILIKDLYFIILKKYETKTIQLKHDKILMYINNFINKNPNDEYFVSEYIFSTLMSINTIEFGSIVFYYDKNRHGLDIGTQYKEIEELQSVDLFFEYE